MVEKKSVYKFITVLFFILVFTSFVLSPIFFVFAADVGNDNTERSKLGQLRLKLEKEKNYILEAEVKMLERKYEGKKETTSSDTGLQFGTIVGWGTGRSSWLPSTALSGMRIDLYGNFRNRPDDGFTGNTFDLITGKMAIDESLQLGSINSQLRDENAILLSSVKNQIENYKYYNKTYPSSLLDFAAQKVTKERAWPTYTVWYQGKSQNIADLARLFDYKITSDGKYTLTLKPQPQILHTLSDITPLEIRPHPWDQMIGGRFQERSKIFSLVPNDHFLIYFEDAKKVVELEDALKEIVEPFDTLYNTKETLAILEKVTKRLGITNYRDLASFVSEIAFVSEDLDFYPKTDYALIVKLEQGFLRELFENFKSEKNYQKNIDEYLVLSTSQKLLLNIESSYSGQIPSMYNTKDFIYMLSVLEPSRDGFGYFSESFITKLVSPEYRILARRRNAIIQALETLQYIVFAYRDLKGYWPKSFAQIFDEGYVDLAAVYKPQDYSIDEKGFVNHQEWGNIKNISSVSEVDLTEITKAEKLLYEQFRDGYQNYWRQFFDPIGIAVSVSDQIMLHTVILPLIDESEYNGLEDFFGGDPISFQFVLSPHRVPALQVVGKINNLSDLYYEMLYSESKEILEKRMKEEVVPTLYRYGVDIKFYTDNCSSRWKRNCMTTLRNKYPQLNVSALFEEIHELEKPIVYQLANQDMKKWLKWEKEGDILGFVGDEVMFGIGEDMKFSIKNIADLDIYLGIKLRNVEVAKEFLLRVFAKFAEEFGQESMTYGGFLSVSTTQPIKNTYRDVEYYLIPTGFVNGYYTFLGDSFYFTISQLAINKIIDAYLDQKGKTYEQLYSTASRRGLKMIGEKNNIVFHVDFDKMNSWKENFLKEFNGTNYYYYSYISNFLQQDFSYLSEAVTLAKTLPGYDNTLSNVNGVYYHQIPKESFGGKYIVGSNAILFETDGVRYTFDEMRSDEKFDLLKSTDVRDNLAKWDVIKNVSLGLKLTKDGLDSRLSFNNPLQAPIEEQKVVTQKVVKKEPIKTKTPIYIMLGFIIGVLIIIVGVAFALIPRGIKPKVPPTKGSGGAAPDNTTSNNISLKTGDPFSSKQKK